MGDKNPKKMPKKAKPMDKKAPVQITEPNPAKKSKWDEKYLGF